MYLMIWPIISLFLSKWLVSPKVIKFLDPYESNRLLHTTWLISDFSKKDRNHKSENLISKKMIAIKLKVLNFILKSRKENIWEELLSKFFLCIYSHLPKNFFTETGFLYSMTRVVNWFYLLSIKIHEYEIM